MSSIWSKFYIYVSCRRNIKRLSYKIVERNVEHSNIVIFYICVNGLMNNNVELIIMRIRVGDGSWLWGGTCWFHQNKLSGNCSLTIRYNFRVTHHALLRTATFPVSSKLLTQSLKTPISRICIYWPCFLHLLFSCIVLLWRPE